jgi:hypothetical protein
MYWEVEAKIHTFLTLAVAGTEKPASYNGKFTLMEVNVDLII